MRCSRVANTGRQTGKIHHLTEKLPKKESIPHKGAGKEEPEDLKTRKNPRRK